MPRFSATLDKNAKGITVLTCVVMIIPYVMLGKIFAATGNWTVLIPPVIVLTGLICCFLWRPKDYSLELQELQIHRIVGDLTFPVSEIERMEPIDTKEQGTGIRTFGSGGFFGYFGRFWYKKLRSISMYATDKSKLLLISFTGGRKPIIISPDDTEGFIKTFRNIRNQRATR